jgi:hypothetical protein
MGIKYRYTMKNTGGSSTKYGPCEVCGKRAAEVWSLQEERAYKICEVEGWTQADCKSMFGHKECLEASKR